MKRYASFLMVALFSLGFFATLSGTAVMADEVTVKGTVNELRQIEAEDEEVYTIDKNEVGEELKALVGKKVEATGTVEEGYGGAYVITVTSYKIIE
jgi:hypothetical protein